MVLFENIIALGFIVGGGLFLFYPIFKRVFINVKNDHQDKKTIASKENNNSVNDLELDKKVSSIMSSTSILLWTQSSLIRDKYELLPEKAKDNWSLGYIAGFVDSGIQRSGIPYDKNVFAIMSFVFQKIYGNDEGPLLFAKFVASDPKSDLNTSNGMQVGAKDFLIFISTKKGPMRWSKYVHNIKENA